MNRRIQGSIGGTVGGLLAMAALVAMPGSAAQAMQAGPAVFAPPGDAPALEAALVELRSTEARGGWGTWEGPGTLRPGDIDPSVRGLRLRLWRSGDLVPGDWAPTPSVAGPGGPERGQGTRPPPVGNPADLNRNQRARGQADLNPETGATTSPVFDPGLEAAVRRFQHRHGLDVDGIVGPATRTALNVTVGQRIRQVEHNLRLRSAFSGDSARITILVNIPAFRAWVFEEGRDPEEHRVIVGRVDRPTPILSGRIEHVVLAPFWNVPTGILLRDKLPILRRDPAYLERQRMSVMDRATGLPVPPGEVDWSTIPAWEFNRRYWLRQAPGPGNALGDVKFIFPNPHDVYLHDTPDLHLFERGRRAFSSGCMRLDRPLDLANRLLASVPGWSSERMHRVIRGGVETWVRLPIGVPIQLVYWTAWVARDGTLHLHEDLYGLGDGRDLLPDRQVGGAGGGVQGDPTIPTGELVANASQASGSGTPGDAATLSECAAL